MSEPTFIICKPTAAGPSRVPGSRIERCSRCAVTVHLSPSAFVLAREHAIACMPCALTLPQVFGDEVVEPLPPTDAQLAEISLQLGRPVSRDEIMAMDQQFADLARMFGRLRS